jgi:hypothetical protein
MTLEDAGRTQWDVFISHASEDKEAVAIPLAKALQGAGLKVWLDKFELHIGDSLREKIDEGLAQSRFGILILSPSFLAKRWPKQELNGMMAIEEAGHKVILPVWHGIDKAILTQYSPILADRLAADTANGIQSVAAEIIKVVLDPRSASPAVVAPSLGRRFIELLDRDPDTHEIQTFLASHPAVLLAAIGIDGESLIKWACFI